MTQFSKQSQADQTRLRMIAQNQKLYNQITMLQQKMSQVITKDITQAINKTNNSNSRSPNSHSQISIQQSYIKRLKNKINHLKSVSYIQGEGSGILLKEQNQLTCLKRQFESLIAQKNVMQKQFETKKTALLYNNPLHEYKDETADQMNKVRKNNADFQAKIVELERQIRKYHKYQQLHKAFKDTKVVVDNPEFQITKLEHQKNEWLKKTRVVESKWQPQIQSLDKYYFAHREIILRKQKIVQQLQKQLRNWQNRASAVRNEADVLKDRERVSRIPQSPHKQQMRAKRQLQLSRSMQRLQQKIKVVPKKNKGSISGLVKQLKQQSKIGIQINKQTSNLQMREMVDKKQYKYRQIGTDTKQIKPTIKQAEQQKVRHWDNNNNEQQQLSRYGSQSERIQVKQSDIYQRTRRSLKNEFMHSKQAFSGRENTYIDVQIDNEKKRRKMLLMKSVGVGTSFYYNENED